MMKILSKIYIFTLFTVLMGYGALNGTIFHAEKLVINNTSIYLLSDWHDSAENNSQQCKELLEAAQNLHAFVIVEDPFASCKKQDHIAASTPKLFEKLLEEIYKFSLKNSPKNNGLLLFEKTCKEHNVAVFSPDNYRLMDMLLDIQNNPLISNQLTCKLFGNIFKEQQEKIIKASQHSLYCKNYLQQNDEALKLWGKMIDILINHPDESIHTYYQKSKVAITAGRGTILDLKALEKIEDLITSGTEHIIVWLGDLHIQNIKNTLLNNNSITSEKSVGVLRKEMELDKQNPSISIKDFFSTDISSAHELWHTKKAIRNTILWFVSFLCCSSNIMTHAWQLLNYYSHTTR